MHVAPPPTLQPLRGGGSTGEQTKAIARLTGQNGTGKWAGEFAYLLATSVVIAHCRSAELTRAAIDQQHFKQCGDLGILR